MLAWTSSLSIEIPLAMIKYLAYLVVDWDKNVKITQFFPQLSISYVRNNSPCCH